jgi:hypothetical protein
VGNTWTEDYQLVKKVFALYSLANLTAYLQKWSAQYCVNKLAYGIKMILRNFCSQSPDFKIPVLSSKEKFG